MRPRPLIKQIKRIPYIFLLLILTSASIKIISDWTAVGKIRSVEVRTHNLKEKTYNRVELKGNSFITGMEGTLHWKVKNVQEAFLIGLADGKRLIGYFDVFYFLLLDAVLFLMVYRIDEDSVFSKQFYTGMKVLLYCIMLYPFVMMIGDYCSSKAIQELTSNQFQGQFENFGVSKFQLIIYLLIFMYPFLRKATHLQHEQNLTI